MRNSLRAGNFISKKLTLTALTAALMTSSAFALPVRDDQEGNVVDTDNVWAGVGQMYNLQPSPFVNLCTGQLINPRTVIFAAHCVHVVSDESYGANTGGIPISFQFNPENNFPGDLQTWAGAGFASQPDLNLYNVLQVQTVLNQPGGDFPLGDVAIASFDTHIDNLPTYGMLFSPLDGPTHATMVGYGRAGNGSGGPTVIDFKRRVGENMIDGLFSQNDYLAGVFNAPGFGFGGPSSEQLLYHIDFDRPDRDPNACVRGGRDVTLFGIPPNPAQDITCNNAVVAGTLDGNQLILISDEIDYFPGDALPVEAGTAGGDSGGGLFADEIYERPLVTGVLSGGWVAGFFDPNGGYASESYYNPLFIFRDWIQENNPYVYASAKKGNGKWSDPDHWRQDLDPNYFIIDRNGVVRNGVPSDPEPGLFADRPKFGTVFDLSVPDEIEGATGASAATSAAATTEGVSAVSTADRVNRSAQVELPEGVSYSFGGGSAGGSSPAASDGAPTGPGSTGFVPNNDWGTYGTWSGPLDGVARFYDVTLAKKGRTTLDMNAEIDRLSITGPLSKLKIKSRYQLNALAAVDQFRGFVDVDGVLETREYALWGGFLTGDGTINADTVWNINGVISAGGLTSVGDMTINGDYVQSSEGVMLVNMSRRSFFGRPSNDFIQVNGDASLGGLAIVAPTNIFKGVRWGDSYTVLNADNVVGNFDDVALALTLPILYGESVVQSNGDVDIEIRARRLRDLFSSSDPLYSLGEALDEMRWGGNFNELRGIFDFVDNSGFNNLSSNLVSLTPTAAFSQSNMVMSFNAGFTGHLTARGAELRAGLRGVSYNGLRGAFSDAQRIQGVTAATSSFAPGRETPAHLQDQRFGMFVSSRGINYVGADQLTPGSAFNSPTAGYDPLAQTNSFENSGATYGDITIGADYRIASDMVVGVAMSTSTFDLTSNEVGATSNKNFGAALYGSKYGKRWYVDGYYGFSQHSFELGREMPTLDLGAIPTSSFDIARSAPDTTQTMAGLRGGYTFTPTKGLTLGPIATLSYSNARFKSFEEYTVSDFSLIVDGRNLTSFAATMGLNLRYDHALKNGGAFSFYSDFTSSYELGDRSELITAAFALSPENQFTIARPLDGEWHSAMMGVAFMTGGNFSTNLQFGADFDRGPLSQHYGRMSLDWRF